jgi:Uri superfamily endonuclease
MKSMIAKRGGTYVLILRLARDRWVEIGKLGGFHLRSGFYAYAGSAFGPGGLAGRLQHHLRPTDRPHWHVDYLRKVAPVDQVWFSQNARRFEHDWAAALREMPGASIPVPGFGASDCKCRAHLFHFEERPCLSLFRKTAGSRDLSAAHSPIRRAAPAVGFRFVRVA